MKPSEVRALVEKIGKRLPGWIRMEVTEETPKGLRIETYWDVQDAKALHPSKTTTVIQGELRVLHGMPASEVAAAIRRNLHRSIEHEIDEWLHRACPLLYPDPHRGERKS